MPLFVTRLLTLLVAWLYNFYRMIIDVVLVDFVKH